MELWKYQSIYFGTELNFASPVFACISFFLKNPAFRSFLCHTTNTIFRLRFEYDNITLSSHNFDQFPDRDGL